MFPGLKQDAYSNCVHMVTIDFLPDKGKEADTKAFKSMKTNNLCAESSLRNMLLALACFFGVDMVSGVDNYEQKVISMADEQRKVGKKIIKPVWMHATFTGSAEHTYCSLAKKDVAKPAPAPGGMKPLSTDNSRMAVQAPAKHSNSANLKRKRDAGSQDLGAAEHKMRKMFLKGFCKLSM
ncbi:hypothetical protein Ciccas_013912 [Cichlidogyrus casuarinus]|uniref:Uncharacterized protein n=1 Tax=Cichlidogyrus casuarinus TaxID=1844966 RepID=A0ABD2PMC6_9PLAT